MKKQKSLRLEIKMETTRGSLKKYGIMITASLHDHGRNHPCHEVCTYTGINQRGYMYVYPTVDIIKN